AFSRDAGKAAQSGWIGMILNTRTRMNARRARFLCGLYDSRRKHGKETIRISTSDLNDIPEASDEQLHRARRIAIRIAPRLLAQLRRLAAKQSKPYQTLIHKLLERAAEKNVA
ncbi:MAG TPA: hypothetical protein VNN16_04205, partial [Candidatus Sulfotelmatobacter sp.]|nr:hypothetical protein [Candidatus Sulfotelmatobacter sp.]